MARNSQQGEFIGGRLESAEKCKMRVTTGWVEYGSVIGWTEERESVMITMGGD